MDTFQIVGGLIMGGFIWFFIAVVLEEPALNRIRDKKYGKGSTQRLSKEEKQSFYVPLAIISILLGLLVSYLGSKGLLPNS
jgi:stalled ribosome alternative rescue factor ArfA